MSELAAATGHQEPAGADKLGLDIFPHITILHILRSHYTLCPVTSPPPATPGPAKHHFIILVALTWKINSNPSYK